MATVSKKSKEVILKFDFEKISVNQFKSGIDGFLLLLQDISRSLVEGDDKIDWNITVASGSDQIIATPEPYSGVDPQQVIDNGVSKLEENVAIRPDYFSDNSLRLLKSLASLGDENNKIYIGFNGSFRNLTHRSVANVNELLGGKRKSYGSLDGKLDLITDRGGLRFEISDRLTKVNIRCYINQEDVKKVIEAFGERVKISGLLNYRKDGTITSIKVDEFRVVKDKDRPNFHDMIGILSE